MRRITPGARPARCPITWRPIRLIDTSLTLAGPWRAHHRWEFETMYAAAFEAALRELAAGIRLDRPFETAARDHLVTLRPVERIYAAATE